MKSILLAALSLAKTVLLGFRLEEGGDVVLRVRPHAREALRCPACGRRCECHDHLPARRWRALDLGASRCFLEYAPARVRCPEHGVLAERVPWARRGSRFTSAFEDQLAWCACHLTVSAAAELMRVEWHTVGGVCARVFASLEAARGSGRLDGLRRIGIDETSYKKGHRYITVVVDHDTGRLVWAHDGYGKEVLSLFLGRLTREQRRAVEVVTADGAKWIKSLVKARCPNARWVMDPFHVVQWMNDAVDALRAGEWREAKAAERAAAKGARRRPGRPRRGEGRTAAEREAAGRAAAVRGARWALVKGRESLTEAQRGKLSELKASGSRLFRAWDLKEDLRAVFRAGSGAEAGALLDAWIWKAGHCRIDEVVEVEKKVRRRRRDIAAAVELGISNARVESINNKVKVSVRMAYGFRNPDNMISLLMLRCSDMQPQLPGRGPKRKRRRDYRAERKARACDAWVPIP